MTARGLPAIAIVAGLLLPTAPFAGPVAVTGTGGGPNSTITAPYTATSGKTVPRPSVFDPSTTGSIELQAHRKKDIPTIRGDSIIMKGICIGCD
jgi:hypothetical protein